MTDAEIALHAAINVLRDTIECERMPSGLALKPDGIDLHKQAIDTLETMLRDLEEDQSGP